MVVDGGAYSVWPWTAGMDAGMSCGIIPGPYRLRSYRYQGTTVTSNKAPLGPYRGVARPGACFAIERTIDEVALALGLEAKDVRARNMIGSDEFPYTSVTGKIYDSGDYVATVEAAAELVDHDAVRARQGELARAAKRAGGRAALALEEPLDEHRILAAAGDVHVNERRVAHLAPQDLVAAGCAVAQGGEQADRGGLVLEALDRVEALAPHARRSAAG